MQKAETRKEFEQGRQVGFNQMITVYNVMEGYSVGRQAEMIVDDKDHCFENRADALKAFKQFRWEQRKYCGVTVDIDDFSFDSIGWYVEVQ
jgi:hypothetical protein